MIKTEHANFVIGISMLRLFVILLLGLLCIHNVAAESQNTTDSLLKQLEIVISDRAKYISEKESRLDSLSKNLQDIKSEEERFNALGKLFDEYHSFNADSAYAISLRQVSMARELGNENFLLNAQLNKAIILCNTGMYIETQALLDSIQEDKLPEYLKAYYFHTRRTLYGRLADYAAFKPEREHYARLTDQYRDSLLSENDPNSFFYALIKADQLNVHGQPQESIDLLNNYIKNNELSEHDNAIFAWSLADSYGQLKDSENQKKYLLISAISDMKSAVREYVSLRDLALLLYAEGDLDRAYRFFTIAIEDASKCNARQRIIELNDSYPTINKIYVEAVHAKKTALERTIIIIAIMSVILIILLIYMRRQMVKITKARRDLKESNERLNELNGKLKDSNSKLNELVDKLNESNDKLNELNAQLTQSNKNLYDVNRSISEISELKEVYICQYMEQSLAYIELLDNYRKTIGKLYSNRKFAELDNMVKSTSLVDNELKAFYEQFDKTFLTLFPNFVEDFNKLLLPGESILPKKAGHLTTELRVYALIRLGINDSDKIAKFLRYSLSTIYNYRTKVRNKANGDRNKFEEQVVKIAQQSSSR